MRPDPYRASVYLTNPQTLNRYTYSWGDPVNKIDPLGLDSLLFDGCNLTRLGDDGKPIENWKAVSGLRDTNSNDQKTRNAGPLPEGAYTANPAETGYRFDKIPIITSVDVSSGKAGGISVYRHPSWALFGGGSWGDYRTPLHPDPGTDTFGRDGFFLHGGEKSQSAGCIDLTNQNDAFHKFLQAYGKPIKLVVKYTCNPWDLPTPQGAGGGLGSVFRGWPGYPSWWFHMWNFANWVNSIEIGQPGDDEDHLA